MNLSFVVRTSAARANPPGDSKKGRADGHLSSDN